MEITREKVVSLLIEGNGKVKNSDLLGWFRSCFDSSDPVAKKHNRDLFKRIVNHLAVVKEIDDVKYVVLKTKYHHLLTENQHGNPVEKSESSESRQPGVHIPGRRQRAEEPGDEPGGGGSTSSVSQQPLTTSPAAVAKAEENELHLDRDSAASAIEFALKRTNFSDLKLRKSFHCEIGQGSKTDVPNPRKPYGLPLRTPPTEIHNLECVSDDPSKEGNPPPLEALKGTPPKTSQSHNPRKSYGLPLRAPPTYTKSEIQRISDDPIKEENPAPLEALKGPQPRTPQSHRSPLLGRAVKITKPSQEEPVRDPRFPSPVPLEATEHEWLVKSAAGQWGQVYGLMLQDNQLVEKRDFMSGFTALHWAAKWGNSDMLAKMIRVSRERGAEVDVNARTHGGYTPLHIAALHDQEFVLGMLVREFGADARLRDNCGKRAYHYLHRGMTGTVRELLGEPRATLAPEEQEEPRGQPDREEADLFKGLQTISRLFQPHVSGTHRKKHKHRSEIYSLSEDPREESE
ncbi:ankyrin repeat domain-containing protein SOWAHA-like [Gadus chalcogrammus]|uniref:ankyrin repeat domain-containing protein SOWAHA-like n=1 Tax=Gadus chalcogrammus TaxID=1042646 RepID=UPI0024C4921D|nr:ankyrin repeat domain-containing protein SOWAHA-like [Gadus chalcogrammus]